MSLKIRLTRGGAKKRPHYHIIVADSRAPRDGRFIDRIGAYDPMLPKENPKRFVIDLEKTKTWLGKGAQPTDRVHRFLSAEGLLKPLPRNNPQKSLPKKRAQERAEAQKAAEVAAAEAASAAAAAAAAPPPALEEEPLPAVESSPS